MISHDVTIDKTLHLKISAYCEAKDQHMLEDRLRESIHLPVNIISLDFTNVRYISSSAVRILFQQLRKYYPEHVEISIDSPPEFVRELLKLIRLDHHLAN